MDQLDVRPDRRGDARHVSRPPMLPARRQAKPSLKPPLPTHVVRWLGWGESVDAKGAAFDVETVIARPPSRFRSSRTRDHRLLPTEIGQTPCQLGHPLDA